MRQRLNDIDLCLALAIHLRLIHCQRSSSTVVFRMAQSIVRQDERAGQRTLNTADQTLATKRGRPFLNRPLRVPLSWYAHKDTLYSEAVKLQTHSTKHTCTDTHPHTHTHTHPFLAQLPPLFPKWYLYCLCAKLSGR